MITCRLGEKEYAIDFVSARAMREIGPAEEMYNRILEIGQAQMEGKEADAGGLQIKEALDVMVNWFCVVFKNQVNMEEVYDGYPVDKLAHDIAFAMVAVRNMMTDVLKEFPMNPAANEEKKQA